MTIKDAIVKFLNTKSDKKAHLSEIYEGVSSLRGETPKPSIRNVIETHSSDSDSHNSTDIFYSVEGKGKGVWGLRDEYKI